MSRKSDVNEYTCGDEAIWCAAFVTDAGFDRSTLGQEAESWAVAHYERDKSAPWDGTPMRVSLAADGSESLVLLYLNESSSTIGWVAVQAVDQSERLSAMDNSGRKRPINLGAALSFNWLAAADCRLTVTVINTGTDALTDRTWLTYIID